MGMTDKHVDTGAALLADVEPAAELLRCLAHPQRLMIVCTLMSGERAVSELERELSIRQPSLSQHLASLREADIITGRRKAKAVFYRLSDHRTAFLVETLHAIFCEPAQLGHQRAQGAPSIPPRPIPMPAGRQPVARVSEAAFFARIGEGD
jgi:ArsR family transcriptional regulator